MNISISIGDILVFLTLLVFAWQTNLLRKQINQQAIQDLFSKWAKATEFEITYPSFHKMVLEKELLEVCASLSKEELRDRALAWFVFDTIGSVWSQTQPSKLAISWLKLKSKLFHTKDRTFHDDATRIASRMLSNPRLQKAWIDWGLRQEWEESAFQRFVDEEIQRHRSHGQQVS